MVPDQPPVTRCGGELDAIPGWQSDRDYRRIQWVVR
jgi:hypothetical protein